MSHEFIKTTWNNGASPAITAEQLNRIEDGIADAIDAVNDLETGKQDELTFDNTPTLNSQNPVTSSGIRQALDLKANSASPNFTGVPTAPTAVSETSSQQIATTAFVKNVANPIAENVSQLQDDVSSLQQTRTQLLNVTIPGINDEIDDLQDSTEELELAEEKLSALITTTEETMVASKNYDVDDLIIVDDVLYRVISPITRGTSITPDVNVVLTTIEEQLHELTSEVNKKADKGGNYPDLTAGNANQLVSDSYVSDNAPYMMRPSAGGAEIGNREIDELVGGTIAWNQLAGNGATPGTTERNGVTFTVNADGSVDVSGTATATTNFNLGSAVSGRANHKRLIIGCPAGGSGYTYSLRDGYGTARDVGSGAIDAVSHDLSIAQISIANGYAISGTLKFKPLIFDLTAMFGTTIADYIYALETATPGAGVAWFRRLFPADYYAYDAGTLKSVEGVSAHRMTGKNLLDLANAHTSNANMWFGFGAASTSPGVLPDGTFVLPEGIYTLSASEAQNGLYIAGADGVNIATIYNNTKLTFTNPFRQACRVTLYKSGVTQAYWSTITVQLEQGSAATEYEPYTAHTYPLDSTLTLRGITKLDSANRLYYDGDTYASDGTVTRKYGVVDLGTLNWAYDSTYSRFAYYGFGTTLGGKKATNNAVAVNIICSRYDTRAAIKTGSDPVDKSIGVSTDGNLFTRDTAYTDAATFKTAMSGVYLVYELATPIIETADSYTNPQIVSNDGTEQYVTTGILPVGHETKYLADLKSKLEVAPDSPDTDGDYVMRRTSGENVYTPLASAPAITTLNERKADIDGDYPNMVVGNAEQLVATVGIEDETPYLFRTSGGSIDIGDREEDMLVGGTIAWNQLYKTHTGYTGSTGFSESGLTVTVTDGYIDVTGTSSAQNNVHITVTPAASVIPANHVYLLLCDGWNSFAWARAGFAIKTQSYYMTKHTADFSGSARIWFYPGETYSIHARFSAYDLTQMFGSAIADYIYNLESANAGDGVAWFRKLFPKNYYPFDAGTLMSVENVSAHRMTGFNQWDEEWELGSIDSNTGGNTTASTYIRAKNYIPVVPDTVYSITRPTGKGFKIYEYDASQNFITANSVPSTGASQLYTTGSNTHYIRYICGGSASPVTTYGNNICIHLAWDGERNGEYEAYKEYNYPLDSSVVLRGIPKLDGNNQLYYDGDTYASDGTVTRKYGIVDLGTLTWLRPVNTDNFMYTTGIASLIKAPSANTQVANIMFAQAEVSTAIGVDTSSGRFIGILTNGNIRLRYDGMSLVPAEFKAAVSGWMLVYELANPTTESADPYSNPQIVDDWGTEEYVTDSIVPVGHQTIYQANLRAKLEMSPDSPEGDGDYIVRQTNGENSYVPLVIPTELPTMPSENGTYVLKVTVVNGTPTLAWVSET